MVGLHLVSHTHMHIAHGQCKWSGHNDTTTFKNEIIVSLFLWAKWARSLWHGTNFQLVRWLITLCINGFHLWYHHHHHQHHNHHYICMCIFMNIKGTKNIQPQNCGQFWKCWRLVDGSLVCRFLFLFLFLLFLYRTMGGGGEAACRNKTKSFEIVLKLPSEL